MATLARVGAAAPHASAAGSSASAVGATVKPKYRRLAWLILCGVMISTGSALILRAFSNQIIYFYTPTALKSAIIEPGRSVRLGGLVEVGSVTHPAENSVVFTLTDLTNAVTVRYQGVLPQLFKEGQGVVAEGVLTAAGQFSATTILAKHDENYLPPEVVNELKKSGRWQHYSKENQKLYAPAKPAPERAAP